MKKEKSKYILFGIIAFIYFIIGSAYQYSDLLITTSHGIELWSALFSGNFFNYYNVTYTDIVNSGYEIVGGIPGYDFLIYVIFGIWNFPLWIAKYLLHVNIWESVFALTWAKGIVFFFSILSVKKMIDICSFVGIKRDNFSLLIGIFFFSPIYILGAMIMSQYDVIYLTLLLASLDAYLKDDMRKFIFFSAIAFPIKILSFFVFLPLLLYKEKNILKIIISCCLVLVPWGLFQVLFERNSNSGIMVNMMCMFHNKLDIMNYEIPLFPFCVIIFYFLCYVIKPADEKKEFNKWAITIAYLSYLLFFVICIGNAYWAVLMIPFQILFIAYEDMNWISLLACTISEFCYVVNRIWAAQWSIDVRILRGSFLGKIFGQRRDDTENILQMLQKYVPSVYQIAESRVGAYTYALFVIFSILLLYIVLGNKNRFIETKRKHLYYVYALRIIGCFTVLLFPVIAFIF